MDDFLKIIKKDPQIRIKKMICYIDIIDYLIINNQKKDIIV